MEEAERPARSVVVGTRAAEPRLDLAAPPCFCNEAEAAQTPRLPDLAAADRELWWQTNLRSCLRSIYWPPTNSSEPRVQHQRDCGADQGHPRHPTVLRSLLLPMPAPDLRAWPNHCNPGPEEGVPSPSPSHVCARPRQAITATHTMPFLRSGSPRWPSFERRWMSRGGLRRCRILNELNLLQLRSEDIDLDMVYVKVQKLIPELGFMPEDADRLVTSFSGGWKMRMSLDKILIQDPDLHLLDEPTNHVDWDTVEWLECYIKIGYC